MNIDKIVFIMAGSMVLISLLLSRLHSPYWLWLTAFVGANMIQAAFTGVCPAAKIAKALGAKTGRAFD